MCINSAPAVHQQYWCSVGAPGMLVQWVHGKIGEQIIVKVTQTERG